MDESSTGTELASAEQILKQLLAKKADLDKVYKAETKRYDDGISRTKELIFALRGGGNEPQLAAELRGIRQPRKRGKTNGQAIRSIVESSEPEGMTLSEIVVRLNEIKPRANGESWANKPVSNECNDLRRKKLLWKDDRGRWHPGPGPENGI